MLEEKYYTSESINRILRRALPDELEEYNINSDCLIEEFIDDITGIEFVVLSFPDGLIKSINCSDKECYVSIKTNPKYLADYTSLLIKYISESGYIEGCAKFSSLFGICVSPQLFIKTNRLK